MENLGCLKGHGFEDEGEGMGMELEMRVGVEIGMGMRVTAKTEMVAWLVVNSS